MDRFYLFDASFCPIATMGSVPIYSSTPERAAASRMTAFTTALEGYTGQVFNNYDDPRSLGAASTAAAVRAHCGAGVR